MTTFQYPLIHLYSSNTFLCLFFLILHLLSWKASIKHHETMNYGFLVYCSDKPLEHIDRCLLKSRNANHVKNVVVIFIGTVNLYKEKRGKEETSR